jgi:hypothetical protein
LRPAAFKAFVMVGDEDENCRSNSYAFDDSLSPSEVARNFDRAITELAPEQFGTATARRYAFFSIAGFVQDSPATETIPPTAPVATTTCPTAFLPGEVYQSLSIYTGATRFSLCNLDDFDPIFRDIAARATPCSP